MQLTLAGLGTVNLNGGPSDNTFNVTVSPTVTFNVNGGGHVVGDVLNVNVLNKVQDFTAGGILAAGEKPVNFTNVSKPTFTNGTLTGDQRFVEALYLDNLGRLASVAEIAGWLTSAGKLNLPATTIEFAIANSQEAMTNLVNSWYSKYLGRAAGPGEGQGWVNELLGRQTEEVVLAQFLTGSGEFQTRANVLGGTSDPNANFVSALYILALGRTPGSAEVAFWVARVPSIGLFGVAIDIFTGVEFRGITVASYYANLLHRQAAASDIQGWASGPYSLLAIRDNFEAGPEFYNNG
jgi:hypothetical protein